MKINLSTFLLISIGGYSDATAIKNIGVHDSQDDPKLRASNAIVQSNQAKVTDFQGERLRRSVHQDSILVNDADQFKRSEDRNGLTDVINLEDETEWYEKDDIDRDALVSY